MLRPTVLKEILMKWKFLDKQGMNAKPINLKSESEKVKD
jgi:hypothetical protein